ncbi:helix-turn-helix transcriptional regulator [Arthrobacter sp. StoSoilB13]|uniref:helix-turn-helix transcriptional regulator n=1 Tax=Arthrobacter sp. StoSoilB13 TaxID=2830993 RepID=UPI001CC61A85|nr:helix-turn-helix transcriptional regulator [Arthrobacter sp. StoSoilB13]
MSINTEFEEDEMGDLREYGQEAMQRRLGQLAKQRREELGFARAAFAVHAGLGSDATVRDVEFGRIIPRSRTLHKLELALGWRVGSFMEFVQKEDRKASSVMMEELDAYDSGAKDPLSKVPTVDLLQEVIRRLTGLQENLGVPVDSALTQQMLGLAAMGHKPEHLDDDGDDDISGFGPSAN